MSTKPPVPPTKIDKEFEKAVGQKTLETRPDEVTSTSTVRTVLEGTSGPPGSQPDVSEALKDDLETVKETFALSSVPREAYLLGLAGTLPYMATSLSTAYLSWNLNHAWPTQSHLLNTLLFNHESAGYWLHLLEPIQVGYGAVIISFLGAIHWGLEFAEKQPNHTRTRLRYAMGVLAPAVAWPTIFMPVEWALTAQFAAFSALYYADSRATVKGWVPPWYGTYRFVLTAVVGTALLVSLIARAKIGEEHSKSERGELSERIRAKRASGQQHHNWAKEEAEERVRLKEEKKKEEEEKKREEKKKAKEEKEKKEEEKEGKKKGKKDSEKEADRKEEGKGKEGEQKGEESEQEDEQKDERKDKQKPEEKEDSGDKDSGNDDAKGAKKKDDNKARESEDDTEAAKKPQQEKEEGDRKSEKTDEKVNRK
ncbi:hypothetical protein N0V88_006766 [Collariella sp. IMI 366227]|nr:hypothetical protein N0V88_006766 [Collariella sp. IMI 366227]